MSSGSLVCEKTLRAHCGLTSSLALAVYLAQVGLLRCIQRDGGTDVLPGLPLAPLLWPRFLGHKSGASLPRTTTTRSLTLSVTMEVELDSTSMV